MITFELNQGFLIIYGIMFLLFLYWVYLVWWEKSLLKKANQIKATSINSLLEKINILEEHLDKERETFHKLTTDAVNQISSNAKLNNDLIKFNETLVAKLNYCTNILKKNNIEFNYDLLPKEKEGVLEDMKTIITGINNSTIEDKNPSQAATFKEVSNWEARGINGGYKWLISVCDTFDYSDYPVFVYIDEDLDEIKKEYSTNMQQINEIIDLEKVASDRNIPWIQNFSEGNKDGQN